MFHNMISSRPVVEKRSRNVVAIKTALCHFSVAFETGVEHVPIDGRQVGIIISESLSDMTMSAMASYSGDTATGMGYGSPITESTTGMIQQCR